VDANFVMSGDGRFIEVQATAEGQPFDPAMFNRMSELATHGVTALFSLWQDEEGK